MRHNNSVGEVESHVVGSEKEITPRTSTMFLHLTILVVCSAWCDSGTPGSLG